MLYRVYKNLHNGKWSIKNKKGLVVGHADSVTMVLVEPTVSEAGRQRVIREKKKNVHAYMIGFVSRVSGFMRYKDRELHTTEYITNLRDVVRLIELSYNPYKGGTFVNKNTGQPVTGVLSYVFLKPNGVYGVKDANF
jgi:hypothetical protein